MSVTVKLSDSPARPKVKPLAPRPAVLVVASPDGFVEVYGSPGVRVHIAERIDTCRAGEVLADELLMARLPAWARDVYWADCLLSTHTIRPRSLDDEAERVLTLDIMREMGAITSRRRRHA